MTWTLVERILERMLKRKVCVVRILYEDEFSFSVGSQRTADVVVKEVNAMGMYSAVAWDKVVLFLNQVEVDYIYGIVKGWNLDWLLDLAEKLPKTEFWDKFVSLWLEEVVV